MISTIVGVFLIVMASLGIAYFEGWYPFNEEKVEEEPSGPDLTDPIAVAESIIAQKHEAEAEQREVIARQARIMAAARAYLNTAEHNWKFKSLGLEFQDDGINKIAGRKVGNPDSERGLLFGLDRLEIFWDENYAVDEVRYGDTPEEQIARYGISLLIQWVLQ